MDHGCATNPGQGRSRRAALISVALLACVSAGGCVLEQVRATPPGAEEREVRGVSSTYALGRLESRLSSDTRVEAVVAAARQSLERRGYTIKSVTATRDEGYIKARGGRHGDTVIVRSYNEFEKTYVRIRVWPMSDGDISLSIMDDLLARLGY